MNKVVKIFFVIVSLVNCTMVYSQAVTWQNIYNYNNQRTYGRDVQQTFDGGYIICGNTTSKIYLVKVNYLGDKEWDKLISDSSGNSLYANAIQQTPDSGFVMIGNWGISLSIFRTDKSGNLLWKKKYDNLGGEFRGRAIVQTSDGGYIACGSVFNSVFVRTYVVKVNQTGSVNWEKVYSDSGDSEGYDIKQLKENFYMVGISAGLGVTKSYGYIRKLDYTGIEIQKHCFIDNGFFPKIEILNDNRLVMCGLGGALGIFYLRMDTCGKILNEQVIYTSNFEFYFYSMCINTNQQVIVCANERYPKIFGDLVFAAAVIDTNGKLVFEKRLNSPQDLYNVPYSIRYTSDGGYIFTGDTEYRSNLSSGETYNIIVSKTDSLFNCPKIVNIQNNSELIFKQDFLLYQNYPNPFNPTTKIRFEISRLARVKIVIYDILGNEIERMIDQNLRPGSFDVTWSAKNISTGVYFYSLYIDELLKETKAMIFLK